LAARSAKASYAEPVSVREITSVVLSDRTVHRAERVPGWRSAGGAPPWRALCGVPVGKTRAGGSFEFNVAVALDPQAWRLAANCSECLAVTERRELSSLA
jgi:hypothetical protein